MNSLELENLELRTKLTTANRQIIILIKQCDNWAKSYDNLLKDFIAYREKNNVLTLHRTTKE